MAAMKKYQSNYHPIRSNPPPDQVVEEGLNETGSVDAKTVRFCEEDGRMHSADKGFEACQEFVRAAAPVTTSHIYGQVYNEVMLTLKHLLLRYGDY